MAIRASGQLFAKAEEAKKKKQERHFNEDKEGYTFWDYMRGAWQKNNGMRIDHFLVSNSIIDNVKDININKDPRGREKPSDHTPIEIKLA